MAPPTTKNDSKDDNVRQACLVCKRIVFGITNIITLVVTCFYISHAFRHYHVISDHATDLKLPFGNFDLSFEKVGYSFAIGRVIFLAITIIPVITTPEWLLFVFALLHLVFEVPMAAVAESNFGYSVAFSQLDLSPPHVSCYVSMQNPQVWDFFTVYGKTIGRPTGDVCEMFKHEGSLLRGSLMFSWFTLWICWFLIAFFGALCSPTPEWSNFAVYFTGFNFTGFWDGFKRCFTLPRCSRRKTNSEASTLADEEVSIECKTKS